MLISILMACSNMLYMWLLQLVQSQQHQGFQRNRCTVTTRNLMALGYTTFEILQSNLSTIKYRSWCAILGNIHQSLEVIGASSQCFPCPWCNCWLWTYQSIHTRAELYKEDLPCLGVLADKMLGCQLKFKKVDSLNLPKNFSEGLKNCNEVQFSNIFCLVKIDCITPVTSCICERSFSATRRLNNYMPCSMGQDRLSSLVMTHINYGIDIVTDDVIDISL